MISGVNLLLLLISLLQEAKGPEAEAQAKDSKGPAEGPAEGAKASGSKHACFSYC